MRDSANPYAPPASNLNPSADQGGGCWRDGDCVVVRLDRDLPCRCVKCNGPVEGQPKTRTVYWHHPALYLMVIFPGLLIYAIVALIVRKKATITPALCAEHAKKRNLGLGIGWGGAILGIVLMIASAASDNCGFGFFGLAIFLGALVAGSLMSRILFPSNIDEGYVRLKGAGMGFLQSLPPFHG